jgi:hypothetical protein
VIEREKANFFCLSPLTFSSRRLSLLRFLRRAPQLSFLDAPRPTPLPALIPRRLLAPEAARARGLTAPPLDTKSLAADTTTPPRDSRSSLLYCLRSRARPPRAAPRQPPPRVPSAGAPRRAARIAPRPAPRD